MSDHDDEDHLVPGDTVPVCNSLSNSRSIQLVSEEHGARILSVLRGFRDQGILFDFYIRVQDEVMPCHRCVIAACSHFFRAMFEVNMRECDEGSVTLNDFSPSAVRHFLHYAYSGELEITEVNVDTLFHLASFLQVDALSHACSEFLIQTLNFSNCLHLLAVAEGYGSSHLRDHANQFVVANFHELSCGPDFVDMVPGTLRLSLASDSLSIPDEEHVLRALLHWTNHDLKNRRSLLPQFLPLVRLHQIPVATLEEMGGSEPLLLHDADCSRMMMEALEQVKEFSGFFPDARPATTTSYIYVHKTEEDVGMQHTFYYNIASNRWHQLPVSDLVDLPGSSFASFAEKLFVSGGCRGKCCRAIRLHLAESEHDATEDAWCYCPVTATLSPIPAMPHPRTMHSSISSLSRIYVIGGKSSGIQTRGLVDVECYDPLQRAWSTVSPLPCPIYFPEAAVCGSVIYMLGSKLETSDAFNPSVDCFFRYDAAVDQWCQLVAEFGQFFHATLVKAVGINETLYLCDLSTYKVFRFCPDTCAWNDEGSFECAGFNAGAIGLRDKIYILGGDYCPGEITDEVQVYHIDRGVWQEVMPMPRPLTEFHCQEISFNTYRDPWRAEAVETQ